MKNKKRILVFTLFIVPLLACSIFSTQPSESAIQTAIAQTQTAQALETFPSPLPMGTPTKIPTETLPNRLPTETQTGLPTQPNTPTVTNAPTQGISVGPGFDVIFVIDTTQGVNSKVHVTIGESPTYLDRMNEIMTSFIDNLEAADRVGFHVVSGDNPDYKVISLTGDKNSLKNQILPEIINDLREPRKTGSTSKGVEGTINALGQFPPVSDRNNQGVVVILTRKFPQWDSNYNLKVLVDNAKQQHIIINSVLLNSQNALVGPPPLSEKSGQTVTSLRLPLQVLARETSGIQLWRSPKVDSQWQALIETFNNWFVKNRGAE